MSVVISIIVPVYNVEKYLRQCLNSILEQDFQAWECILIDDGSTDISGAICDEYSSQDNRFRIIHQKNRGVSAARNAGLESACGDWICFVDSDDRLEKGALSYMLEQSMRRKADAYICTIVQDKQCPVEAKVLNKAERRQLIWSCLTYRTDRYTSKGFMIDAPHAKLFRASVISNNKLRYVVGLCKSEDALFDAQFYHHAACIVLDTRSVYRYTINPASLCHTYKLDKIPMFGLLLQYEASFVGQWYADDPMFDNVLAVRTFVALEQVLYEAGAEQLSLSDRIRSLRLFLASEPISAIISDTKYSAIYRYVRGRSKYIDLFLIRKRMLRSLCLWIRMRQSAFRMRVSAVAWIKRLLHTDQNIPLTSLLSR